MKTLRKVGELLRQFTAAQPEHSVTDLSRAIGNSVSGTHDLVNGLARIGLLRKVERGRYRLGPLVATLNRAREDSSALTEAARPVLAALWRDYGETLHLTLHDHGRLLVLDALEGTQALRVSREALGSWIALHDSPPGMLHLAQFSPAQLDEYLDRHTRPGSRLEDRARLRAELDALARDGFNAGAPKDEADVICVSALIRDHIAQPVAVLVISVPRSRHEVQPRAFRNIALGAVRTISERLGYELRPN
ncbi:IclR family transcriptional regulator [Thioclava sp. F28-4]|uniref:IclR family transcriptional regulator n=1 Tax=Thioclava sp. F28-4 TaxID=1915315 RepID=UPI0009CB2771|nr:IclR family transcriptional regulator C-terminal domain-containing protein [Thioclava sp. F28-4]OOY06049.1 hypothetical protein BMI87_00610 [Thioclava sp. F28-4]